MSSNPEESLGFNPEILGRLLASQKGLGFKGGSAAAAAAAAGAAAAADEEDDGVDRKKWSIIYPAYLNKKYTIKQGRRVSLNIAVDNPTTKEIKIVCEHLHIPCHIEASKRYARDWLLSMGRVRVEIKKEDGSYNNTEIQNKKKLMDEVCRLIPQLKTRSAAAGKSSAASTSSKKKKKK